MGEPAREATEWALIDSHAHLDDAAFDADRDAVVARAREAGVAAIVTVGADLASSRKAVDLAERYHSVYAAVGVHPHDATRVNDAALAELRALAAHPKVVAIGETGLDFYRDLSPRPAQLNAFRAHLELAAELDLPAIVHDREAHAEVMRELEDWTRANSRARGVLHCFSGDEEMAHRAADIGFWVSLAGTVTFAKASRPQRVAAAIPLERLVVETDCPYLAPEPRRGRRNEPAYVRLVAERVARLRGIQLEQVARASTAGARALFGLEAT